MTPLQQHVADHSFLLSAAAKAAGLVDPVAIDLDSLLYPLLGEAVRGPFVPLSGVLVRDWDRSWPKYYPGVRFGARIYTAGGIRFVRVVAAVDDQKPDHGYQFVAVSRADYTNFFRFVVKAQRKRHPEISPPILPPAVLATVRQNTVDFLAPKNLKRIRALGGRPRRGLLFTGPPGNGKTTACRWVLRQCNTLGYETKQITPDDYRAARHSCNPAAAVRELFRVTSRGVVFFDDMDLALRDRGAAEQSEDQAVFLGALDGIEVNEGVVYVFTTNLSLDRIDPAFRRPGRLDLIVSFPKPDAALRRAFVERWHPDTRAALDLNRVVADSDGLSFAELDELKNLLVLRYVDTECWDWGWAVEQFHTNRDEFVAGRRRQPFGFAGLQSVENGVG